MTKEISREREKIRRLAEKDAELLKRNPGKTLGQIRVEMWREKKRRENNVHRRINLWI